MIRGTHQCLGRAFAVADQKLYEVFEDGTFSLLGTLLTFSGTVAMSNNASQLCIVDGLNGYILTLATNTLVPITADGWRGSYTVCFVDDYFIFVEPDSGRFYISKLGDGTAEDPLDFATAEGSPDNLVACAALSGKLWLLGTETVQVYYDSGDNLFPFAPIPGAFIQYGCDAAQSVQNIANTLLWLGTGTEGNAVVWMASSYAAAQRVSTYAVESIFQEYGDKSDAVAYTYEEDGHYFYVLNFPTARATWVYDIGLNEWHERAYWNSTTGEYEQHLANCHMFAFGKHLMGDRKANRIFEQSLNFFDDDGDVIRRLRSSPHEFDSEDLNFIYYNRFQLDMMTGIGSNVDPDPQMGLQWSNDAGHTWSNLHYRSCGKIGQFKLRALWRQLGRSRDRVFRCITTARAPLTLISAYVEAQKGNN